MNENRSEGGERKEPEGTTHTGGGTSESGRPRKVGGVDPKGLVDWSVTTRKGTEDLRYTEETCRGTREQERGDHRKESPGAKRGA